MPGSLRNKAIWASESGNRVILPWGSEAAYA
jgi:hypothetical protein